MKRRNLLLGIVAFGFGSSGFIASSAFDTETPEERGNWVETSEVDDEGGEVRVETIADLDPVSDRFHHLERDDVSLTRSSVIQADESGFLQNVQFGSVNDESTTRVGHVDGRGVVDPAASAFVIANLGGVGTDVDGRPVELDLQLYDDTDTESRSAVAIGDAVQFHYTMPAREQSGELLAEDGVVVAPRELLCVAVEIDSRGSAAYDRIESIDLTIRDTDEEATS